MRAFYQSIISSLHIYCGARAQMRDWSDDEITKLLDVLEKVSKLYSYIPEEKQKEIIEAQLLKDKEYQNINARLISKWLEENGKSYYEQSHHKEKVEGENYKPLEGEEREKRLEEWKKELQKATLNFTGEATTGSGSRLRNALNDAGIIHEVPKAESSLDDFLSKPAEEQKEILEEQKEINTKP